MNVKLGKYNQLEVVKEVDFGVYLDGGDDGEILLPTRYVPEGCKPGDVLNVFLYLDNEERLIATTLQPLVQVDEFAGERVLLRQHRRSLQPVPQHQFPCGRIFPAQHRGPPGGLRGGQELLRLLS